MIYISFSCRVKNLSKGANLILKGRKAAAQLQSRLRGSNGKIMWPSVIPIASKQTLRHLSFQYFKEGKEAECYSLELSKRVRGNALCLPKCTPWL